MREAMARAEVGDDVYGEDPTVNRLQERVAELLGKEAALYVPSGSMANQIALKIHTRPGDDVIIGGLFTADDVRAAFKVDNHHFAPTRLVCLENTHNRGGGRIWPRDEVAAILAFAREKQLRTHLDGARIWNVTAATGVPEKEVAAGFDTVSCCLSKGLGAPVGSLLAGSKALVHEAHRVRKMLGGGMRQAGILAAAGLYALDKHRARLVDDHANARRLAELLAGPRYGIDLVETNIVIADLLPGSADAASVVERARAQGVLLNTIGPRRIRLVTHLDVDRAGCERAADVLQRVAAA
jgi:threonine aldolase